MHHFPAKILYHKTKQFEQIYTVFKKKLIVYVWNKLQQRVIEKNLVWIQTHTVCFMGFAI